MGEGDGNLVTAGQHEFNGIEVPDTFRQAVVDEMVEGVDVWLAEVHHVLEGGCGISWGDLGGGGSYVPY